MQSDNNAGKYFSENEGPLKHSMLNLILPIVHVLLSVYLILHKI